VALTIENGTLVAANDGHCETRGGKGRPASCKHVTGGRASGLACASGVETDARP
jgi:hypothetical protein